MSLTSHLSTPNSPVKQFLFEQLGGTRKLTGPANKLIAVNGCLCLPGSISPYPWGDIGRAIDYRIRFFFEQVPLTELVAWQGAQNLAFSAPGYAFEGMEDSDRDVVDPEVVEEFFTDLEAFLEENPPSRRLLDTEQEALLARYCFVLSLFESKFRSGLTAESLYLPPDQQNVNGLVQIPPSEAIADLVGLSTLFYGRCQDLLNKPTILNPVFAGSLDVGGADADLIVDGCLIDIKCSKTNALDSVWLRQLAGYILLDYEDSLQIRSAGFYLARQGLLVTWSLEEFFASLTGNERVDLVDLRARFRSACEGGSPRRPGIEAIGIPSSGRKKK